jgi:hypothetical protein
MNHLQTKLTFFPISNTIPILSDYESCDGVVFAVVVAVVVVVVVLQIY